MELSIYPQWWKRIPGALECHLVERALMRRLRDLQYDDLTIIRDGGVRDMIPEEVTMACDRRGLAIEGKGDKEQRKMLDDWLSDRNSDSAQEVVERVRGSAWDDWRGNATSM